MIPFVNKIKADFLEAITKSSAMPHNEYLFKTHDEKEAQFLPEQQVQRFHHSMAQWPDIQVAISFLASRVKRPDEDDWGKLQKILQCLKGTRSLTLQIKVNYVNKSKWLLDASHGVHWDCKRQTGTGMMLGK